jgi:hypothetical protein
MAKGNELTESFLKNSVSTVASCAVLGFGFQVSDLW